MSNIRFSCTSLAGTQKQGIIPKDANGYYDMVIGGLDILNSAGEYYDHAGAKELFQESSSFMRRVKRGALRGEVGHPRREHGQSIDSYMSRILDIDEKNVCVHFSEIYLDFESFKNPDGTKIVAIRAKLAPSGPKAEFLKQSLENKQENVCFSIRSFTENTFKRGRTIKSIKTIVTFDYVNEPGIHIAEKYKSPALEGYATGRDVLVTQDDFQRACDEAVKMGIATESSVAVARDMIFKQFGWKPQVKTPGWMAL